MPHYYVMEGSSSDTTRSNPDQARQQFNIRYGSMDTYYRDAKAAQQAAWNNMMEDY